MLVLSRKKNESVIIDDNIVLKLLGTKYNLAIFNVNHLNSIEKFERSVDECFNITKNIEIFIIEIQKDKVKIGIKAPKEISVYREEIFNKLKQFTS